MWIAIGVSLMLAACKVDLYTQLDEQAANEMVAALSAQGIAATKRSAGEGQWQLLVDEDELGPALQVLQAQGLPHDRYTSLGDLFERQGLVSTPVEERMRYIYGTSQELARTLQTLDGVVAARVHVVIPANDPLSENVRPSSAAVFIKHTPDVDLRLLTPAVKDLVAHSIEGLTHDQVSLTLYESKAVSLVPPTRPQAMDDGPFSSRARWTLIVVGALGVASLATLPLWLRRRSMSLSSWVRQWRVTRERRSA